MSLRDAAASLVSDLIGHIQVQGQFVATQVRLYLIFHCLMFVSLHLSLTPDSEPFQLLILSTIVTAIRHGLRSKMEYARHEFISVLSQLVRSYPSHPRFVDMVSLCHDDPEADFYENVKHVQLHRRTRAFRKLAVVCREGTLSQTGMMSFLLPLANQVS